MDMIIDFLGLVLSIMLSLLGFLMLLALALLMIGVIVSIFKEFINEIKNVDE